MPRNRELNFFRWLADESTFTQEHLRGHIGDLRVYDEAGEISSDEIRRVWDRLAQIAENTQTNTSQLVDSFVRLSTAARSTEDALTQLEGSLMPARRRRGQEAEQIVAENAGQLSLIPDAPPTGELRQINIYDIQLGPNAAAPPIDPEFLASIVRFGVLTPITVVEQDPTTSAANGYNYRLVAGRRRILAMSHTENSVIPALVFPRGTPVEVMQSATLIENNLRADNVVSDYNAIRDLVLRGFNEDQIATDLGIPRATVRSRARLGALLPRLFNELTDGGLSPALADRLARMDSNDQSLVYEVWERTLIEWDGLGNRPHITAQMVREALGPRMDAGEQIDAALEATPADAPQSLAAIPETIICSSATLGLALDDHAGRRVDRVLFVTEDGRQHRLRIRTPIGIQYSRSVNTSNERANRVVELLGGTRDTSRIMPAPPPVGAQYQLTRPMRRQPNAGIEAGPDFAYTYYSEQYVSGLVAEVDSRARAAATAEERARTPRALPAPAVVREGLTREQIIEVLTENGTYSDVDVLLGAVERALPATMNDDADRIQEAVTMLRAMLARAEV